MIFHKPIIANSRAGRAQYQEVMRARQSYELNERQYAPMLRANQMRVNEGIIPQDVFQEFDRVSVERFRLDDGDVFLNDLLPLSRSINIGKLVHKYRKVSDAGVVQTSMTGQIGVKLDQTESTFDGSIVPIHDTGFTRNFREWSAQNSEGFDALIDDQREHTAALRTHVADSFLDGHKDNDGNFIVVDGISWKGMRADTRVAQVDLGAGGVNFDFTDNAQTGDANKAAFITLRDTLTITNKCGTAAMYYVSLEIMSNWERKFSTQYDAKIIMQEMADLMGVAGIKASNKLSGNEVMAYPLDSSKVRPVVGMAINTVTMPRPLYNSDYSFVVWGAIGFEIRNDFAGNTCAMFAQG